MTYAIKLENLHKTYPIYNKPIDRIKHIFFKSTKEINQFRALNGLNLTFPKGESIGVLGRNGAGKSTLLKIITGVTTPTEGNCSINGRVAAILELNAGFDNELTGYENIFLKGTIIGYSDEEIQERLEEIIEFADLGEHLYQPVRTYSSGMKSRLGFAIAVHVDPDILIIDEALSVGDETFKLKCLNKIRTFKESGKTILFVSHSLRQVRSFCSQAVWLLNGKVNMYGDVGEVTSAYEEYLKEEQANLKKTIKPTKAKTVKKEPIAKEDYIELKEFYITNTTGEQVRVFHTNDEMNITFHYELKTKLNNAKFAWAIFDKRDIEVYSSNKRDSRYQIESSEGEYKLTVKIPHIPLLNGKYRIVSSVSDETGILELFLSKQRVFHIKNSHEYGTGLTTINHEILVEKTLSK